MKGFHFSAGVRPYSAYTPIADCQNDSFTSPQQDGAFLVLDDKDYHHGHSSRVSIFSVILLRESK